MSDITMQAAIEAGDETLHGAIDYWQKWCDELESALVKSESREAAMAEKLKAAEEALTSALENKGGGYAIWGPLVAASLAKIKEASNGTV